MRWLRKLMFWRRDAAPESEVDGCFTLPGVPIDAIEPVGTDDACD